MQREVNPLFAVIAAVIILVIAAGVYFYTGSTSTHAHKNIRTVQGAGGPMPQQPSIPKAP